MREETPPQRRRIRLFLTVEIDAEITEPLVSRVEELFHRNAAQRTDLRTELSPVVGTEEQSEEVIRYLMAEFEEAMKFGKSKYPLAKKWFLNQFPNFKITEGKKAVSDAKIAKIKANANSKVILMKKASGQN